jgi:hypothetical protein
MVPRLPPRRPWGGGKQGCRAQQGPRVILHPTLVWAIKTGSLPAKAHADLPKQKYKRRCLRGRPSALGSKSPGRSWVLRAVAACVVIASPAFKTPQQGRVKAAPPSPPRGGASPGLRLSRGPAQFKAPRRAYEAPSLRPAASALPTPPRGPGLSEGAGEALARAQGEAVEACLAALVQGLQAPGVAYLGAAGALILVR